VVKRERWASPGVTARSNKSFDARCRSVFRMKLL
jgi:hypothetical protein